MPAQQAGKLPGTELHIPLPGQITPFTLPSPEAQRSVWYTEDSREASHHSGSLIQNDRHQGQALEAPRDEILRNHHHPPPLPWAGVTWGGGLLPTHMAWLSVQVGVGSPWKHGLGALLSCSTECTRVGGADTQWEGTRAGRGGGVGTCAAPVPVVPRPASRIHRATLLPD